MNQTVLDVVEKLQEIQALTQDLDERSTQMVEELCASILVVFTESK